MKRKIISIVMVALVGTLLLGVSQRVQADNPHGCSNATLTGSYGFYGTGSNLDGPKAAVGIAFYDGKGNVKGRQRVSRNGSIDSGTTFSFEYEVAADCTGKGLFSDGEVFIHYVIVDGGNGFYFLSDSGDLYVGTKIHP